AKPATGAGPVFLRISSGTFVSRSADWQSGLRGFPARRLCCRRRRPARIPSGSGPVRPAGAGGRIRPGCSRFDGRPRSALYPPLNPQQQDGAEDGDDETADIKAAHVAETECRADESADDGAQNTENDGDDYAAGIFPRHDGFGNDASNQSKNDPGQDTHGSLLLPRFAALFSLLLGRWLLSS